MVVQQAALRPQSHFISSCVVFCIYCLYRTSSTCTCYFQIWRCQPTLIPNAQWANSWQQTYLNLTSSLMCCIMHLMLMLRINSLYLSFPEMEKQPSPHPQHTAGNRQTGILPHLLMCYILYLMSMPCINNLYLSFPEIEMQSSPQHTEVVQPADVRPKSYLIFSCVDFWFCNFIFGGIAFIFSSECLFKDHSLQRPQKVYEHQHQRESGGKFRRTISREPNIVGFWNFERFLYHMVLLKNIKWFKIEGINFMWHSSEYNFTREASDINH